MHSDLFFLIYFLSHTFCLPALSMNFGAILLVIESALLLPPAQKKMHLIHLVLGGFTNIAIKQSQCFYCALDPKIEAALTAGSRRTYGKGLVFVHWR